MLLLLLLLLQYTSMAPPRHLPPALPPKMPWDSSQLLRPWAPATPARSLAGGGYLANVQPSEWAARYERRLPEVIGGAAFLERYGTHWDAATSIDPEQVVTCTRPWPTIGAARGEHERHPVLLPRRSCRRMGSGQTPGRPIGHPII